jgi:hypothetical protein
MQQLSERDHRIFISTMLMLATPPLVSKRLVYAGLCAFNVQVKSVRFDNIPVS